MKKNMFIRTEERPLVCEECGKCFRWKSHLQSHLMTHKNVKPHVCDVCQKTFTKKGSFKSHMEIHTGDKPHISLTPSLASEACSYTFIKDPGYTIVLTPCGDTWQAMVHDKHFPELSRSFASSVKFEKGYRLEDFITKNSSWQSSHIHVTDKGKPVVFIGSFGLKGGGNVPPTKKSDYSIHLKCGYMNMYPCPYFCFKCDDCGHVCVARYCGNHCANFCKCHRVCRRIVTRAIDDVVENVFETERTQERIRQQERMRQEREQIRQLEEQRQAVLSKLDNSLASAQENASLFVPSISISHFAITDKTKQEDAYAFTRDGFIEQECINIQRTNTDQVIDSDTDQVIDSDTDQVIDSDTNQVIDSDTDQVIDSDTDQVIDSNTGQVIDSDTDQVIDSDTDSPSVPCDNNNHSTCLDNCGKNDNHKAATHCDSSDSVLNLGSADSNRNNHTDQEPELLDTKPSNVSQLNSRFSNSVESVDPSLTTSFLANYTAHLSPEEQDYFYHSAGKIVEEKLSQVDVSVQFLLNEVITYSNEDDPSQNSFRVQWLNVTEQYSISDQVALLKSLRNKKNACKLSLLDIINILDLMLHTGPSGYDIVCSEKESWLLDLKSAWLEPELASLTNFSVEEQNELGASLAAMDWSINMLNPFIKSIQDEVSLDPAMELLETIKCYQVPDSLVLPTILVTPTQPEKSKAKQWTHTIIYYSLLHKFTELPPKGVQDIRRFLYELPQSSCSAQFLDMHLPLIKAHPSDFARVLELLYDYQVTEEIWASAFSLLPQISAADWVNEIDQAVASNLFQDVEVYTTDELIQQIVAKSFAFTPDQLRASYDAVMQSYRSPSAVLRFMDDPHINKFKNKSISDWYKKEIAIWAERVKSPNYSVSQSELIAGVRRAVELHYEKLHSNFSLRDTQLLSLLTLLNPSDRMGRLAQINTGEGKSLIVAMLAAIHALQGKKVDVITTSTELSIPEVKKQTSFFESLSLTVAENSNNATGAKLSAYKSDVLYGTSGDFQADILRTEFLGDNNRGDRRFDIVIVDEVDSMLFDNRSHSVRLSEHAPGMTHLELPLAAIWEHIQRIVRHLTNIGGKTFFISEDFERKDNKITLYSKQDWESCAVEVEDIRLFITEQTQCHLKQLLRELNDEEKNEYDAYKKLNNQIFTLKKEISKTTSVQEKQEKEAECESQSEKLKKLPWNHHYPVLDVPIHLRDFAISQIPFWIRSALNAAYSYNKGAHYMVQDNRIVPVHYNETGVLQFNMVWCDGLTQFLQLKEGLSVDPEGVATNFISNVSFFKRYGASIYGLTGTLGEQSTKDFLHQMYDTDSIIIPPYWHRNILDNTCSNYLCKELVPIVFSDKEKWYQAIISHALNHAQNKRAVLVICKFIGEVKYLAEKLCVKYDASKIFTYTGEGSKFEKSKIDSGEIVVATNIAGRGTDLETSLSVESHGGMYVAVTFLPDSYRVEMQNVGRTARAGKKGMAQLIIYDPIRSDIQSIKEYRDTQEVLANEKALQEAKKTLLQDHLFSAFCSLEREYLPAVSTIWLVQKWRDLTTAWRNCEKEALSKAKINKYVNQMVLSRKKYLIQHSLESLSEVERSKITKKDEQIYCEKAAGIAESERSLFEKQYKSQVLNSFCEAQSHQPQELITCLREDRIFMPKYSDLAKKFDWGLYDRKGLEEDWGFRLKVKHFSEKDISEDEALKWFNDEFATSFRDRASEDQLVRNPYFYVLKGNEYLLCGNLERAIACYDRAIYMDPAFSVNARYNKAQALLTYEENKGDRQKLAYKELKEAKNLIGTISRPALMTFSALIAQHGNKIKTSEHVKHQINLLSQQENYIDQACAVIEEDQSNYYQVKLTTRPISETLHSTDQDHSKAIKEAAINGFTHLFILEKVEPVPWHSIACLALISVTQIIAGCLITAYTGGAVGVDLISEGVSDIITTVKAAYEGSFDWADWAIQKAISLAVSVISSGVQSIKTACRDVVNTAKNLIGKAAVGVNKYGVELAARVVCSELTKGAAKEFLTAVSQLSINKLCMENLEEKITKQVERSITQALLNNHLVVKALELDVGNGNNCWKQQFIKIGQLLLKDQKEHVCLTMLRKITLGVAKKKFTGFTHNIQIAEVEEMLVELTNYTDYFIKKFNKDVENHKSDIESAVQRMDSTSVPSTVIREEVLSNGPPVHLEDTDIVIDSDLRAEVYSSKSAPSSNGLQTFYSEGGPSNIKSIVDNFKAQIAKKLTNVVRTNLVDPAVEYGVKCATNAIFRIPDKAKAALQKKVRGQNDRRHYSNILAHVSEKERKKKEKENKRKNKGQETTASKERSIKDKFNESAQKGFKRIKGDEALDANDLAVVAAAISSPIHVYDKETGRLVDVVGDKLPGKPITLQHTKRDGSGHWAPLDDSIDVVPSGANSCLIDATFAQLDSDKKQELQNVGNLKAKMIEILHNNPKEANKAYEYRDKLEKIMACELRIGGRYSVPTSEELKTIQIITQELPIKIVFDKMTDSKGGSFQFFGISGTAEDNFERLRVEYKISESDIKHYPETGAKVFESGNKAFTLRADSSDGRTISIKEKGKNQQILIRYHILN